MHENYVPDIYGKNIYKIDYEKLLKKGIRCLIFDLDNTLTPPFVRTPEKKTKKLFENLKDSGFKIILFSSSPKNRVEPFKKELLVDAVSIGIAPRKEKYEKIMSKFGYQLAEIAHIGDSLIEDIFYANKMGVTSVLVNPLTNHKTPSGVFSNYKENRMYNRLESKELFLRGKYYD